MDKHDTEQKQAIINGLKARLRWYTYESSYEDFDAKEVHAIVTLLKQMEPIEIDQTEFNPQSGIERLWKRYEKMETDECTSSLTGESISDNIDSITREDDSNKKSKGFFFHRNRGVIGTVVAVSLVFIVFWGTSGSTMADLDTGFFHWLTRGDTGEDWTFFPTQEELIVNKVNGQYHYSDEELPQQYKDEMWMPDTIGEDCEAQLNYVTLGDMSTMLYRNYYNASADQNIQVQVIIYENQYMYERKNYGDFTYLYEKDIDGTTVYYFEKQEEDEIEHAISFYQGKRCYRVQGNAELEKIEEIIVDYTHVVFGK